MKTIVFINNKGGVGKTSLVYHLSWMLSELGLQVVAADLDPQANLSAMFLPEERLEELWPDDVHPDTIMGSVDPIVKGLGDVQAPHLEPITARLALIVGDLGLSRFEGELSTAWPECLDKRERSFRVISSFHRALSSAVRIRQADVVLIDVGPNLGAINRSAILAAEFVVVPLAADLFSLQGLRNLGPTLRAWRQEWQDRLDRRPSDPTLDLPAADMNPIGYVVMQHAVRMDRPVKAYERWLARIPSTFHSDVSGLEDTVSPSIASDPNCLATLKNYRSLMTLAQDALKPMFFLKPADGALGGHMSAVQSCYDDFRALARKIAAKCGITF